MGRPSLYSDELAHRICTEIATGKSLSAVCRGEGMPCRDSVRAWVAENAGFRAQFDQAKIWWAHSVAEEIDDLADRAQEIATASAKAGENPNAAIAALKLQIDSKKWLLSKIVPTIYGDRQTTELVGAGGSDLIPRPTDDRNLVLSLLAVLHAGRPDTPLPSPAMSATSLLPAAEPEPAPIVAEPEKPALSEAEWREQNRWSRLTGRKFSVIE
jgi:hypothetical protein